MEAKFQISFKARLWTTDDRRWGVWAAYTQQNQWQVYNEDISRPFRETNYMPEVFVSYRPGLEFGGFHWRLLNVGFNHQSNGRSDLSRSWNRIFAEFGVEHGNLGLLAKTWYRIKESADEDDNPDITDYYGYGSLTAIYKWRGHSFSLMGRGNLNQGKGAAELTWMSPRAARAAPRLRAGLHGLRRKPDRLQLEPEHYRHRHRAQRRAVAKGVSGARRRESAWRGQSGPRLTPIATVTGSLATSSRSRGCR